MPGDGYDLMDGTSMATPGASGLMALLVERYRQLNQGEEPLSALLRAVAANTADDRGRPGPDYEYGYGVLNGERAAEALEKGWYRVGALSQGDADAEFVIDVPAGAKQLRVMLAWTDTVGKPEYAYGEPALLNDLDLTVSGVEPWVLDRDAPESTSVRGRDTVNNMEQVTIDSPSGRYTVKVRAGRVVSRSQQYVVVWYIDRGGFSLASPVGGEQLAPGESLTARWYNASGPVTVELSYDGGQGYVELARGVSAPQAEVRIPADAPATSRALLRVSDGRTYREVASPLTIAAVPEWLSLSAAPCSASGWELSWDPVAGATGYEVLRADVATGTYLALGTIADTSWAIAEEHVGSNGRNVFAVRSITNDVVSRRSAGLLARTTTPLRLSGSALPFVENFNPYPSAQTQVVKGGELDMLYIEMPLELDPAETAMHYVKAKATSEYDSSKTI